MRAKTILFIGMALLMVAGCKNNDSKPLVFVTPEAINLTGKPGELIEFVISVESEVKLNKFIISTRLNNFPAKSILDTSLFTKNFNLTYNFIVPDSLTSGDMIFTFQAYDEEGNLGESARRVYFSSDTKVLTETGPYTLYSTLSGKQDAFNISSASLLDSRIADSSSIDFKDNDTLADMILAKSWISPAGGKFVTFNSFDYANATDKSVRESFISGNKVDILTNLKAGDIILTKVANSNPEKYAAIRIFNVLDEDSTANDRYEFYMKK